MTVEAVFVNAGNHFLAEHQAILQKRMQMDLNRKLKLLETSLERAAGRLGDITIPVMERYYAEHPGAKKSFQDHGLGNRFKLEAEMVESTVYCLMTWLERPEEIRIMFGSTVPHHEETLKVESHWFNGLVDAAIYVILATIPEDKPAERALWQEIQQELNTLIADARLH
ncbi:MAG: hypothetical protein ABJO01_10980 [Parasphingorhabdus sp.]|uniref:hypothetical protein n=1 Tax=Parasphingorhabdus sp. TaxID=2709688 RepID=UPI00329896CD